MESHRILFGDPRMLEKVFGLLDRDADDFLSLSELNVFMMALDLEPGTAEDFRAFCEQTGANPELGLSVGDFSSAYAETPTDKLEEVVRVHGKEWAAAAYSKEKTTHVNELPSLRGNEVATEWKFDVSSVYGFDEAVTMILLAVCLLLSVVSLSRIKRCYRKCTSEEASNKRDAERLNMIGTTARQIALDLDNSLLGLQSRASRSGFDNSLMYSGNVGQMDFSELDGMLSRLGGSHASESNDED
jgi:hypothetical protein